MKKIIATLLIAALALSFAACGSDTTENTKETENTPAVEDTAAVTDDAAEETPEADAGNMTVGTALSSQFSELAEDTSLDAQAIADALIANEAVSAVGMVSMPIPAEETFLSGFDNYEVKGFTDCVMFAPMIGAIPFVGYVFTVGDGVDAAAFAADLEANANLRWLICAQADEVITSVSGDKVLFVMCPTTFEQEPVEDDMPVDEGIGGMAIEGEIPAYDGEAVAE